MFEHFENKRAVYTISYIKITVYIFFLIFDIIYYIFLIFYNYNYMPCRRFAIETFERRKARASHGAVTQLIIFKVFGV